MALTIRDKLQIRQIALTTVVYNHALPRAESNVIEYLLETYRAGTTDRDEIVLEGVMDLHQVIDATNAELMAEATFDEVILQALDRGDSMLDIVNKHNVLLSKVYAIYNENNPRVRSLRDRGLVRLRPSDELSPSELNEAHRVYEEASVTGDQAGDLAPEDDRTNAGGESRSDRAGVDLRPSGEQPDVSKTEGEDTFKTDD